LSQLKISWQEIDKSVKNIMTIKKWMGGYRTNPRVDWWWGNKNW
jgi:hypothetical protein